MMIHEPAPRYIAAPDRYEKMEYPNCGSHGLRLPKISLGLWQNCGEADSQDNKAVTSCLVGASGPEQIEMSVDSLKKPDFDQEELDSIENILAS